MNISKIRKDFPILKTTHNGKQLVYFDNAASSQRPRQVIEAMSAYYATSHANIHRAGHFLGEKATRLYESSKKKVAAFINSPDDFEVIFTKNVTEAINLIAVSYAGEFLKPGDVILTTMMEHHSNLVPWQMAAKKLELELRFLEIDAEGRLKPENLEEIFADGKIKLVTLTHVSNVLGTINDIKKLVKKAREFGVITIIDAAQSVPHLKIDMKEIGADFLAFTGHKMCGPTGIGVLCGRRQLLEKMPPYMGGGGMISEVFTEYFTVAELPEKFEAGTPPIAEAVGLAAAIDYLQNIGMEKIMAREDDLCGLVLAELAKLDFVKIFGPERPDERIGVISFEVAGVHPHDVSEILGNDAICVRAGHHCAHSLMAFLKVPATTRFSSYFYNTEEEIFLFIEGVKKAYKIFH